LAISLLSALNGLGSILSFIYPFIFISNEKTSPHLLKDQVRAYTKSEILIFGICTVLSTCIFFTTKKQLVVDNRLKESLMESARPSFVIPVERKDEILMLIEKHSIPDSEIYDS
jgi:hypothetical protein